MHSNPYSFKLPYKSSLFLLYGSTFTSVSTHLATTLCIRDGAFTKPRILVATFAAAFNCSASSASSGITRYPIRSPGSDNDLEYEYPTTVL